MDPAGVIFGISIGIVFSMIAYSKGRAQGRKERDDRDRRTQHER